MIYRNRVAAGLVFMLASLVPTVPAKAETPRPVVPLPTKTAATIETGRIWSDVSGRIAEVWVHYDLGMEIELAPFYRDLFRALGPGVKVRVLCTDDLTAQRFCEQHGSDATVGGRLVEVINVGMSLSLWSRDRMIARRGAKDDTTAAVFVPSVNPFYEYEKQNELRTQRMMFRALMGPQVLRSWLHLEGGNVVANDRMVFIGSNVLDENDCDDDDVQMPRELDRITGRPWTLIGTGMDTLPWDHVDMYMTPIGNNVFLVGDTRMGRQLLDENTPEHWRFACEDIDAKLDAVAKQLTDSSYRVLRVPSVFDPAGDWIITYNNVLMEERDGRKVVILPHYELPKLDQAAARVYRELGYEVKTVNVKHLFEFGGAVRCLVNVARREPATTTKKVVCNGGLRVYDLTSYQNRRTKAQNRMTAPSNTSRP